MLFCFWLSYIGIAQELSNSIERNRQSFDNGWKFILADSIAFSDEDFDDSEWRALNLPHDWSIEFDYSEAYSGRNAWLPGGIGWYRKSFFVPKEQSNKEFKIEFDGVYKNASVWVNGFYVGTQHDGYTSFFYNITPFLNFGGQNVFAVRVDNSRQPNCRWYSGSGIYRHVWLTSTHKLAIAQWGTFITTSEVSSENAEIAIKTTIQNYEGASKFALETRIFDPKGNEIAKVSINKIANRKSSKTIYQKVNIGSPLLWSVDTPNLYSAKSTVLINNETVDTYATNFGIRHIEFDAKTGFYLNGKNLKIKGVCLHHDGGILGASVPIEIWGRRLLKLKEIGCNAIRASHNPPSPEFMDLCDTMGFLVMNEFVDKWNSYSANTKKLKGLDNFFNPNNFGDPYFEFEWQKNYKSTILRDRNHPSVIMWSVGNENHPPESEEQVRGLRTYAPFVRSLDSTRPVISGMERGLDTDNVNTKIDAIINTCKEMDLIALNYGEQWCKEIGNRNSGMPYISTESYRYFNSTPLKRFANIERSPWLDVMENDHNMGLFLWVGVDYLGESRNYPSLGSSSGLLDIAGFRKAESYLYEAFWSDKPMVRIAVYKGDANDFSTSGRWGWSPILEQWNYKKSEKKDLVTYTNCESVKLYSNNQLIGSKKLSDFPNWIMKWEDIPFEDGMIKAVGVIGGKEVCEFELNTTGNPYKFGFVSYESNRDSSNIVQIEVSVLDKNGNKVTHIPKELTFSVEGNIKILGLSNGNNMDITPTRDITSRTTHRGTCLVILQVRDRNDNVKLLVSSKGMQKGVFILN